MTMLPLIQMAKNRGIRIRGSRRTTRLLKKRHKHLDELHAIFWEEFRQKFFLKHGRWLKPHKDLFHPKTKADWVVWRRKNESICKRQS